VLQMVLYQGPAIIDCTQVVAFEFT